MNIQTQEQSNYTAISPRPLGTGVASAFVSTKDGKHFAHAITHHNFHPAVPSEYLADKHHTTDDVQSYLDQRSRVTEQSVATWHGGTAWVETHGAYEYDDVSSRYEFTVALDGEPTEANAIDALLSVDPGYLPDDTDINDHVMDDLRAFDRIELPLPEHVNEFTELAFTAHFFGLYVQEFEEVHRRMPTAEPGAHIDYETALQELILNTARKFYHTFEGDILAWQQSTGHSVAEGAFAIAIGRRSSLADRRSFDLPNPQSYGLDEYVIAHRLHCNMVRHLPRITLFDTFNLAPDGRVFLL